MPYTLSPDPCNLYPPSARHYNSSLSIWLSVDPMSDKYPGVSPYAYCGNNPVRLVDPNGREIWLLGTEEERNNAFQDLQAGTNLSLKMDENGLVVATGETINGEKLSRADKKLLTAISDQNVRVDIFASPNNEENSAGGAYMGTIYDPTTNSASSCTNVNLAKISITERDYNANQGSGIIHEATEGYAAGLIAIKKASSIKEAKVECSPKKIAISADNNKLDIMYFNDYNPAYPKDYKLYQKSHRRATPAPNK